MNSIYNFGGRVCEIHSFVVFSGISDGSYKTFATDYYAVLLMIGIVWGLLFGKRKFLKSKKRN